MRPIDLVAVWLGGVLAIYAAPDGLSTFVYLGIAIGVGLGIGALLWVANYFERKP